MRWVEARRGQAVVVATRLGLAGLTAASILAASAIPAQAVISGTGNCAGSGYAVPRSAGKPADVNAARTASANGGAGADVKTPTHRDLPSYHGYIAAPRAAPP